MDKREYSFSELREKQVINVIDGRCLGHICDMFFTKCGKILGFMVPGRKGILRVFSRHDAIFIPWKNICKVGSDVILVELCGGVGLLSTEYAEDEHADQKE